jgi:NAD dependent epimerase/dehydratase family enzyme
MSEGLLRGYEVSPERLFEHGFKFRFTDIGEAVSNCIS